MRERERVLRNISEITGLLKILSQIYIFIFFRIGTRVGKEQRPESDAHSYGASGSLTFRVAGTMLRFWKLRKLGLWALLVAEPREREGIIRALIFFNF